MGSEARRYGEEDENGDGIETWDEEPEISGGGGTML
jgi:hypothetical protein